jgi:hypothetical protein
VLGALVDELPVVDDRVDTSSRARVSAVIATDLGTPADDREIGEDDGEGESESWAGKLSVLVMERDLRGEVRPVGGRFFILVGRVSEVLVSISTAPPKMISDLGGEAGEERSGCGG